MKWLQKHRILISEIISILFIMLFVYTGFSKLMEGNTFHNNLINSPFAHVKSKAGFISWVIPLLEIIVAILLL
ncbi:MauE/DoxX family redox-associated membrane protein, partial [Imtechella halotolerans]